MCRGRAPGGTLERMDTRTETEKTKRDKKAAGDGDGVGAMRRKAQQGQMVN